MNRRIFFLIAIVAISTTSLSLSLTQKVPQELGDLESQARGSNPGQGLCSASCAAKGISGYKPCLTYGSSCQECVVNGSIDTYNYPGKSCTGGNTSTGYTTTTTSVQCGHSYIADGICTMLNPTTLVCGNFVTSTTVCFSNNAGGLPPAVVQETQPGGQ